MTSACAMVFYLVTCTCFHQHNQDRVAVEFGSIVQRRISKTISVIQLARIWGGDPVLNNIQAVVSSSLHRKHSIRSCLQLLAHYLAHMVQTSLQFLGFSEETHTTQISTLFSEKKRFYSRDIAIGTCTTDSTDSTLHLWFLDSWMYCRVGSASQLAHALKMVKIAKSNAIQLQYSISGRG